MNILATILSSLSLLMSVLFFIRIKEPGLVMFGKLFAGALSPYYGELKIEPAKLRVCY